MKANEFVKKFGWDEAKRVVDYRDRHASRTHVYKFNKSCSDKARLSGGYLYTESYGEWAVNVDELKRLIDSYEIVREHCTIERAMAYAESPYTAPEVAEHLKQAITEVESCL